MKIGKTPKKLNGIFCPQCRETKDTLKQLRGPGTREKVSSRRINLEGNTHTGNQCESTPCIVIVTSTNNNPCSFLLLLILSLQQN
jgi:hypothetical protein